MDRKEYLVSLKGKEKLDDLKRLASLVPNKPFVELGVYKGGSALLLSKCKGKRKLFLADSFEGMPVAGVNDVGKNGQKVKAGDTKCGLEGVQELLKDEKNVVYIKGWIEDSEEYFSQFPEKISLLHVDVDYEQPYRDILKHLYSRVVPGGIIIFDDYGYFVGARMAVDDFIKKTGETLCRTGKTSQYYVVKK